MESLRNQIKTYTRHGGPWWHLEKRLVDEGASEEFAKYFVSRINKICPDNSDNAIRVYDLWVLTNDEAAAKGKMLILGMHITSTKN